MMPRTLPAGAIALLVLAAACGEGESAPGGAVSAPGPAVIVTTVEARSVEVERHWTGRMEPLRTIPVQAPREGRVISVDVRDGDRVRSGDVLLRMEGPDLQARRATIEEREAFLAEELARWQRLAQAGAAGPGEVAQAMLRLMEVREETSALDATVETYLVRAPAEGRVYAMAVSPGTNVSQGQALLEVEDGGAFGVRLVVSAGETALLEETGSLQVVDDRGVRMEIERVVFASDPHPAFVRADLYVRGAGEGRRSVTVTYRGIEEVLLVPWTSVANEGDRHWVAVVGGDPAQVERRTVELGRAHTEGIDVRSGLAAGERVIRYEPRSHPSGRVVRPQERSVEDGS